MDKNILDGMSIRQLQDEIYRKQELEAIAKFGSKKEVPYNIKEVKSLEASGSGSLYLVRVEDGCEGYEAIVEVDRNVKWQEDLISDHILNFMLDNDYYEPGDIEGISVTELCRYGRSIFKIK